MIFESSHNIDAKDDPEFEEFWESNPLSRHPLYGQVTLRIIDIRRECMLAWREALVPRIRPHTNSGGDPLGDAIDAAVAARGKR